MRHYRYREIIESLPKKKNGKSSLWVKFLIRKISFPFTYFFINIGFSAWMASVFSIFIAVSGVLTLSMDNYTLKIIGVVLINFWLVLDCVDGNIARVKKSSSLMGDFIDAESGYYISGFVFLAIGIAAFQTTTLIIGEYKHVYIILGAITSINYILTRLIYQKYTNVKNKSDINVSVLENTENKISILRARIDKEIGLSGLFMPFLIASLLFNTFDYILIFYFIFSLAALFITTLYYSLKSRTER